MREKTRNSGIDLIGNVPWGSHFCQFYQTGEDLLDILVPYFKAGLENNEFCMWVTAEPVAENVARLALEKALPDVERYFKNGQLEIIPYDEWYLLEGSFDQQRVLDGWVQRLGSAQSKGFAGLRLTGNTFWLEKEDWRTFTDYEQAVDSVIGQYQMMALCTYSLEKCGASEIADVISNHQFALIKRQGKWEIIESAERRRIEEIARRSESRYRHLFENMPDGFAYHQVLYDEENRPVDYVFLEANDAFEIQTGLKRQDIIGRKVTEIIPGIEKSEFDWIGTYGKVALTGEITRFEQYSEPLKRWYSVTTYSPERGFFVAVFSDITERKENEKALQELAEDLARSNSELQQFAYIASHDLQEPLRMVASYVQLLERRYKGRLDSDADDFIGFAVDGANRMQSLINDLLAYSRVGTTGKPQESIETLASLGQALANLQSSIESSDARITHDRLPNIKGDPSQIVQLFQNLISNAIKFNGEKSPRVHISAQQIKDEWVFSVRDSGIGIAPEFSDRIFSIFQRLHNKAEYPGTGIGLAICKKIVERHDGRIWVESKPGEGSTFLFALPVSNSAGGGRYDQSKDW